MSAPGARACRCAARATPTACARAPPATTLVRQPAAQLQHEHIPHLQGRRHSETHDSRSTAANDGKADAAPEDVPVTTLASTPSRFESPESSQDRHDGTIAAELLTSNLPQFVRCNCGCCRWAPVSRSVKLRPSCPFAMPSICARWARLSFPSCAHGWTARGLYYRPTTQSAQLRSLFAGILTAASVQFWQQPRG